jgi:pyridoxine 5-phosphate synthase
MHPLLGVNIDHCATLRQARYHGYPHLRGQMVEPDPLAFALAAQQAGAHSITVHPREDGRHIQQADVRILKDCLQIPLNLEMACTPAMLEFALEVQPASVCLVPEKREEVTTEGGLDLPPQQPQIASLVAALKARNIVVSLFIDADPAQIDAAAAIAAHSVELHTGAYANAWYDPLTRARTLRHLADGAARARGYGLQVNLGHGINYANIHPLLTIPHIGEYNIGHSIVSRALFVGVAPAVREMLALMRGGTPA